MVDSINQLVPYKLRLENLEITITYLLLFTMVDGSICNTLSETNSTQKCFICGASPSEMNFKRVAEKPPRPENYRFGLSTLHLRIRSFECLLHISYNLPFRKWQARGSDKSIRDARKHQIQKDFEQRMGLIVDKPKQSFGNTNDGNTARRFFNNPHESAAITVLDLNLI